LCGIADKAAGGGTDLVVWGYQAEDVTTQTTQTAGEYVSVGVPSDWAGDELVTNGTFDTDTTGWTAGTGNSLAWQTGAAKCTRAVAGDRAFFGQGFSVVVGAKYVISAEVLSDGTSTTARAYLGTVIGAGDIVTGPAAAFGQVVFEYTAGVTGTIYIWFYGTSTAAGNYIVIDNVSVKPAYYHGSMVDGVKCFATDINGAAIPSTTLLGYRAEGARTNLCLQSNSLNTVPWTDNSGTATVTQNAIGPDGVVSAWTITDDSGVSAEGRYASLVLTAATYTYSVFVKKETGAPTNYPVIAAFEPGGGLTTAVVTIDTVNGLANAWTAYSGRVMAPGLTGRCTSFNSAFWRVEMSFTATAADWGIRLLPAGSAVSTALNTAIDGAVQGSAVFYGAQVELGSSASSYIATTTIAVARNADVLTYPSAGNVSGTVGAAYCEIKTGSACGRALSFNAGGTGMIDAETGDSLSFRAYDETNVVNVTAGDSSASTVKQAIAWGGSTLSAARNGTTASGSFDGNMSPTGISIGGTTGGELNGTIRNVRIWSRQLSASELGAITA